MNIKIEITDLLLYISIMFVISQTLFPIRLNVIFEDFEIYNLIPLKVPIMIYNQYSIEYFLYQTLGNIALLIPFGFFTHYKTSFNVKIFIQSLLMLTLFIEITQGFIPYRFCEIDDILPNTLGRYIGIFFHYILGKREKIDVYNK